MHTRVRFLIRAFLVLMIGLLVPAPHLAADEGSLLSQAAPTGVQSVAYTGCGGVVAPVINAAYEQEVIDRVNDLRASHGLPPFKRAVPLVEAARYHATDMAQDGYFNHDTYDRIGGSLVLACEWSTRIASYYPDWWSLGENIAMGHQTPALVVEAWMNNDAHRANILSANHWETGVGYHVGADASDSHWVQSFGRRLEVYPLVINRDAASTDSQDVSLYIYGDWQEVRLRNDDGTWTDWRPFQSTQSWTLAPGWGDHTVWAEMRNGSLTASSGDSIFLDVAIPALGDLPDRLTFSYNLWNGRLAPEAYELTVANTGTSDPLTWQIQPSGDWFQVLPTTGVTPASLRIEPANPDGWAVGVYPGAVTVAVVDPASTLGSPQTVELRLEVVNRPVVPVFLPVIQSSPAR